MGSYIDFLRKSLIYSNLQKSNQHFYNFKTNIDSYFQAYNLDGMFYGSATNITYKNVSNCGMYLEGQYNLDIRCQPFFIQVTESNFTFAQLFSPSVFIYNSNNQPYFSFGICKKQYLGYLKNKNFSQQAKGNSQQQQFQLVCNSITIEQQQKDNQAQTKQIRILLDPSTQRVIYQNNYIIQNNTLVTIQESYLRSLSEQNSQFFLEQVKIFYTSQKINQCFNNNFDFQVFIQNIKGIKQQFSFYENGNEMVVILQLSYLTDVQNNYQNNLKQFCQSSILIFLTIFSKDELLAQSNNLFYQIFTIDLTFKVLIYIIPCLQIIFAIKQACSYSKIFDESILYIINILKCIKVQQEENQIKFLEKKSLQLQRNVNDTQILCSLDILELYQNIHDLLFTFFFYTFNMLGSDQFISLSQFTEYINHFKKYNNYPALGVCFNNVGCINFNSSRYNEAFDYFSQAIICSKYELKLYKEDKKYQQQNYLGNKESQEEHFQVIDQTRLSKTQKSIGKQQKDKINSNDFYHKNTKTVESNQNQQSLLQDSKIERKQIDLFSKYTSKILSDNQAECFDIYFSRTVNYLKSMIYCMCLNINTLTDWDVAEEVVYTLIKINNLKINQPILQIRNKFNIIEENEQNFIKLSELLKQSGKIKEQSNTEKEFDTLLNQLSQQKQSNQYQESEQLNDESKCYNNKSCFYKSKQFDNENNVLIDDTQKNQKRLIENSIVSDNYQNGVFFQQQNNLENSACEYQLISEKDFLDKGFSDQQCLCSLNQKSYVLNYEQSVAFNLLEDILNQIIHYNDDYFGFINSNFQDMVIQEPVLMTSNYYIQTYKNQLLKQLNDNYIHQKNELNNRSFLNKNSIIYQDSNVLIKNQNQFDSNQSCKAPKLEDVGQINIYKQQKQTDKFSCDNYQQSSESKLNSYNQQTNLFNHLSDIEFQKQNESFDGANSGNQSQVIKQHNQSLRKSYMQNSLFPNLMKKIVFKKIIVAVIENMNVFNQNEMEFQFILKNLFYYDVELCILILDENISMQESNQYQNITFENKNVVSFFHSSKSLLVYLNSNRYSKFHDSTLLYSEHF
ncbi:hypothetical protein ABPG74_019401 [Tetrahymena malaccensis]